MGVWSCWSQSFPPSQTGKFPKLFLLYVGNSFHRGKTDILVGMGSLQVPGVDMGLQRCWQSSFGVVPVPLVLC